MALTPSLLGKMNGYSALKNTFNADLNSAIIQLINAVDVNISDELAVNTIRAYSGNSTTISNIRDAIAYNDAGTILLGGLGVTKKIKTNDSITATNAILTNTSNQLTLGTTNTTTISASAPSASRTYTMPDVLTNADFVMSEGAQTINGQKTLTSTLVSRSIIPSLDITYLLGTTTLRYLGIHTAGIFNTQASSPDITIQSSSGAVNFFSTAVNINYLTASQTVVTDGSKNLASKEYTDAATASTIVSRDANANSTFNTLRLSGLTASQAVVTDANKDLASLQYTNAATVSTLVSRDASAKSSFAEVITSTISTSSGDLSVNPTSDIAFNNKTLKEVAKIMRSAGDITLETTTGSINLNPNSRVNINYLTASQAVVTDGFNNLISLQYTNSATASTLVSRDASAKSSFAEVITSTISTSSGDLSINPTSNINFNNKTLDAVNTINRTSADLSLSTTTSGKIRVNAADGTDGIIMSANSAVCMSLSDTGNEFPLPTYVSNTTDSTSVSTGSIHTDGGIGCTKDLVVGSDIFFPSGGNVAFNYYGGTTFTPGVSFGSGTTGITYTTQIGQYTRIGRAVFYDIQILLSSKGSSTGVMEITNLPFTVKATFLTPGNIFFLRVTAVANTQQVNTFALAGTTKLRITASLTTNAANVNWTDANCNNTTEIYASGFYFV